MPSSIVSGENSLAGNVGDPASTQKLANAIAVKIRQAPADAKTNVANVASGVTSAQITVSTAIIKTVDNVQSVVSKSGILGNWDIPKIDFVKNFKGNFGDISGDTYRQSDGTVPVRELGEPDEETIATISVRTYDNTSIFDSYANFFLQSVSESDQEKFQVVETFTAYYAFFYGRKPPIYTFSGMLLNDYRNNWTNSFKYVYENYIRGTSLADIGAEAFLLYDKRTVSGFLLNLNIQREAANDKGVPFSFSMLIIADTTTEYGYDFQAFVSQASQQLADVKAAAAATSAQLSTNPDSMQTLLKNNVLSGKVPAGSAGATAKDPVSQIASVAVTSKGTNDTQFLNSLTVGANIQPAIMVSPDETINGVPAYLAK